MRKAPIYDLPSSGAPGLVGIKATCSIAASPPRLEMQKGWQPLELLHPNADSSLTWEEAHAGAPQRTLV